MKKIIYITSGLFVASISGLLAQTDVAPAQPSQTVPPQRAPIVRPALSPGNFLKDIGLNAEDLRNLPPQERNAKIKEAMDKKIGELNKKKADGTLTPDEQNELSNLEKREAFYNRPPAVSITEFYKNIGLDQSQLAQLPPQERQAKIKEAMDKKIEELNKKKADNTITPDEQKILTDLNTRKAVLERPMLHQGVPPQGAMPPQRVAPGDLFKEIGVNADELARLPRQEQQAKMDEAVSNKLDELNKKKTAGTALTPEEQQLLPRLEQMHNFRVSHPRQLHTPTPAPAPATPAPQPQ